MAVVGRKWLGSQVRNRVDMSAVVVFEKIRVS